MHKIIRTATIPLSLALFCKGQLEAISENYEVVALSAPGAELEEVGRREKVKTIGVYMSRAISPCRDLISLGRLIKTFLKERPDAVHSMTPKAGLLSMMAARFTGVPVRIHSFTGLLFPTAKGFKKALFAGCDRIICGCASHILAEGKGVKKDLIANRITKKNIKVLGYGNIRGIDLDYFDRTPEVVDKAREIRQELDADESTFVFVFVGRLVGDKGIDNLVNAFLSLSKENKNLRLLLVGGYEANDKLKPSTIKAIHESPLIRMTGWQEDVRPYYAASDILVFPSRREGFPNVVLEAGAMGLSSIVTAVNGCNEIISNGNNGIIIPRDDYEALLSGMKKMMSDRALRERLASVARQSVADRFERGYVCSKLIDYYREILK